MQVRDIMSKSPTSVTPDTSIQDVAKLMVDEDTGFIPVYDGKQIYGTVTDRDICCRAVAEGRDLSSPIKDIVTSTPVWCQEDAGLEDAVKAMEANQIHRLLVVNEDEKLTGILALADISREAPHELAGEVVAEISKDTGQHAPGAA